MALMVEKLQELRSIRIQKLKKQEYYFISIPGRFLPEEDDKFLERVKAAVEEEERQAMAAAGTGAAKDAIANAEESRKATQSYKPDSKDAKDEKEHGNNDVKDKTTSSSEKEQHGNNGGGGSSAYDSLSNLPMEFYHYYYGSNHDMGTLIEVRRAWDSYIRPGGSRIPGHWVQPPPPADEIWASCLVKP
nr:U11/U12 small nuclear ribonucleoprotein 59 kDa protein isoform X1 [Ipomoea batatas]